MKVADVMTRGGTLTNPHKTLRDVARQMSEQGIGAVPVAENDRLVGMVTDRDIVIRGIAEGRGPDAEIRSVMTEQVKYCFSDEDVEQVTTSMANLQLRRLPVVNRDKQLVGVLSLSDLARRGDTSTHAGQALHGISQP